MTLRVRLLLGLVVLAAMGLAVAGVATYHEQKTFLSNRVTEQLNSAIAGPDGVLSSLGSDNPEEAGRALPFGTYAELRFLDGTRLIISRDSVKSTRPILPSTVTVGHIFTLHHPNYRVLAGDVQYQQTRFSPQVPAVLVVAIPLRDMTDALHRLMIVEVIVIFTVLLAMAILAWWVVKLGLKPLEDMERTAGAIAEGDLSQRVDIVDPNTEVGRLGLAINEMMQQIESAFAARAASEARLRRFVGDASHELRTPLTSIRGYAELFRRGAADRPEDLAKAMRRIEEEANRMGVLVDDMLLLARLDQGRPLERQPVDLSRLARDAVDDFRAVSPERPIDFTPAGSVFVPGDEARLRQVLGNLLQNARRHTPADTPVHVRVYSGATDAVIEVADEGPGMSQEDVARAFERFWRSDPSRARTSGGAGLGLAIVAAIAEAHGGRAEVQSTPGVGATFRVSLPLKTPIAPEQYTNGEHPQQADSPNGAPDGGPDDRHSAVPVADVTDAADS